MKNQEMIIYISIAILYGAVGWLYYKQYSKKADQKVGGMKDGLGPWWHI